jgi:antitoxin (DNA-binding transcriptional repressor) of toxin-antitoxin stability system
MFHGVSIKVATIRELRTNFRAVKRKIEEYGEVTITDHGAPAYVIRSLPAPAKKAATSPDYYARLLEYQPKCMSEEETRQFWEEERG